MGTDHHRQHFSLGFVYFQKFLAESDETCDYKVFGDAEKDQTGNGVLGGQLREGHGCVRNSVHSGAGSQ